MYTIDRGVNKKDLIPLRQKQIMTLEEKLGKAIVMRRREQFISQEDFARKAGITRSYMSHIENGKCVASITIIEKIAKTLGITLAELFRDL